MANVSEYKAQLFCHKDELPRVLHLLEQGREWYYPILLAQDPHDIDSDHADIHGRIAIAIEGVGRWCASNTLSSLFDELSAEDLEYYEGLEIRIDGQDVESGNSINCQFSITIRCQAHSSTKTLVTALTEDNYPTDAEHLSDFFDNPADTVTLQGVTTLKNYVDAQVSTGKAWGDKQCIVNLIHTTDNAELHSLFNQLQIETVNTVEVVLDELLNIYDEELTQVAK